jgi:hypothetical protein
VKYASSTPVPSGCSTAGAEQVFTGASASDRITSQYRYVALADNGLFCTPSQPASVQGYQTPTAPSGSVDTVQDGATAPTWGLRATATATSPFLYYSVNGGTPVRFSGSASIGAGSGYGLETSVVFTSCATDGAYCASGEAVRATAYTTRASIASAVVGQAPVVNAPDNNGRIAPDGYQVSYCRTILLQVCSDTNPDTGAPWATTDAVPDGYTSIRVKATVRGSQDPVGAVRDVTGQSAPSDPAPDPSPSDPPAG